jgi:hypothetical protein
MWKLVTTSLSISIPAVVLRDKFLSKIRNSKKVQADIVEFDRMREDDSRQTLTCLPESIDLLLAKDKIEWTRNIQKSLTSGAIDADSVRGALSKGKGGKGKR